MTEMQATIVTVPGTSSASGAGGVVKTESNYPVIIKVIHPLMVIGIRASKVFLQVLVGLMGADYVAPGLLPASDFAGMLSTSIKLAIAPAAACILQNLLELLTRLDQKYPTLTV